MNMYFIALVLPGELNEQVLLWKNHMLEKYKCKVGLKSPAHITLVPPFWMEPEKESMLISDLDGIAATIRPFELATQNFSAFRPKTIFVAVRPSQELQALKNETDNFFRAREVYNLKIETRPFHPHITIATRDLFKRDFYEAWSYFEPKTFEAEWLATGFSLLRHNKRNWDVIHTAPFQTGKG